ncbi:uncharacterized protein LOC129596547 [Paramacrobiotus metropolitanus]|uniref:uncharacterized protein LOC129596547 n=1 Tax=Paramacrobiotus metropolitanus TaxID=2943436 RepID=UPI0024456A11|nr:uncharacterized protein LOC129596547 [Paramacrobiotus metropolitanus]XP_055349836.1 uncharacterized protein LOC129596547 [Paramacrobiotus metropolitanus]
MKIASFIILLATVVLVAGGVYDNPISLTHELCTSHRLPAIRCPSGKYGMAGTIVFPAHIQHHDCRVYLAIQAGCPHNSSADQFAIYINVRKAELYGNSSLIMSDQATQYNALTLTGAGHHVNSDPESLAQYIPYYSRAPNISITYRSGLTNASGGVRVYRSITLDYIVVLKGGFGDGYTYCRALGGFMDNYFLCNTDNGRVNCPSPTWSNYYGSYNPALGRQACPLATEAPSTAETPEVIHPRVDYLWGIGAAVVLAGAILILLGVFCSSKKAHRRQIQYAQFTNNPHSAVLDHEKALPQTLTPDDIKESFKPYERKAEKPVDVPVHGEFF